MATAVLVITLLTLAASLASWLFSQWLARKARVSPAALAVGGGGAVLLIASVASVMVAASTGWRQLVPVQDFSSTLDFSPKAARSTDAWPAKQQPPLAAENPGQHEDPAAAVERLRMTARREERLASAASHLERSEYREAIEIAREYLAVQPRDDDMLSMLARSLFAAQHPGPASIMPAAIVAEWQATDCVTSTRTVDSARWMLDNGCGRVVAVLFASCSSSEASCSTNALLSEGWSYQPMGILMTAANDKPVPLRLGDGGPMVAPIFTIRDAGKEPRRIRYLACDVTAPGVLQVLRETSGEPSRERLAAELRADACYAQVLAWSSSGQRRRGASPETLLRDGID